MSYGLQIAPGRDSGANPIIPQECHVMYHPPLTLMVWPVIYSFSARITATEATSASLPYLPMGMTSGDAFGLLATMSVSISAGAIAFTVIPSFTSKEA